MAVYYKFRSAKDYDTIPVDDHFMSVVALKSRIFEEKRLGSGFPCDLVVTNAQTEEEYKEDSIIPRNTAVSIKRVPRRRGLTIVVAPLTEEPKLELVNKEDVHVVDNGFTGFNSSSIKLSEDTEWGDFGNDIYDIPDVRPPHTSNQVHGIPSPSKVDEERKIQAVINTPALDWQFQPTEGYGRGRGFGRKINNQNFGNHFERITPPPGYVCHRCNTPGHFIQNCPTNGDPNFDIKRAKPPTGISITMLKPTPDGSYVLPDGSAGALKPYEDAFEKEIEGLPSTRSVIDFPPELKCPLCKEMMKDAVFTSKCCFRSFCDKCIRDYTISRSMCACDARNVVADDLLPKKTLRDTINRMLESNTEAKIRSRTQSAASKGTSSVQDTPGMVLNNVPPRVAEREKIAKVEDVPEATTSVREAASQESAPLADEEAQRKPASGDAKVKDVPEATHESASKREPTSQESIPLANEEAPRKPASDDAGKKPKKKKARLPPNDMMPMGPSVYNPHWGMQPGMEGFVHPHAGHMTYMDFGLGPIYVPFGGVVPHDPLFGGQGSMMHFSPQSRNLPKEWEFGKEVSSSGDISSIKEKCNPILPCSSSEKHYRHQPERSSPDCRSRDSEISRSSKRKSDHDIRQEHHQVPSRNKRHEYRSRNVCHEPRQRAHKEDHQSSLSALSKPPASKHTKSDDIGFPERGAAAAASKKRKLSSSETPAGRCGSHKGLSNSYNEDHHSKTSSKKREAAYPCYESSDDDRHSKRRLFKYEPSPLPPADWEKERNFHYNKTQLTY